MGGQQLALAGHLPQSENTARTFQSLYGPGRVRIPPVDERSVRRMGVRQVHRLKEHPACQVQAIANAQVASADVESAPSGHIHVPPLAIHVR